jgi:hypothetical protein
MAEYKYGQHLSLNNDPEFDRQISPGTLAANPGIYRCVGCGDEIAIAKGHKLPPQNHHQHTREQGAILWQLFVFSVGKGYMP